MELLGAAVKGGGEMASVSAGASVGFRTDMDG